MATKVESRPMQSILKRLQKSTDFRIVQFSEQMLMETDVLEWPKVDCLVAFHSTGYPLQKVQEYVKLVKPVTLNDVFAMNYLRSRMDVFRILQLSGIPTPSHIIIDHIKCREESHDFEEHYDYIQYNGLRLNKPFIEKPADTENHNNFVYYPRNTGGGCKKLFRKVKDRSSEFYPDIHQVRRDGTYVYEEFLSTFGTDVKVYTVGQIFAHAEARKSPTLDGKVQRTANGKEVRYPVILTEVEKYMAYQIVGAFKQTVCGFDILRTTNGQSIVCDVNGWSFVKGNVKYYNDCAHIIRILFLNRLQEKFHFIPRELPEGWFNNIEEEDVLLRKTFVNVEEEVNHASDPDEELRIVVVVMRHGDRKPKQKLKFEVSEEELLEYHNTAIPRGTQGQSGINPKKEVKLKSPEELQKLLEKTRSILTRLEEEEYIHDSRKLKFVDNVRLLQNILERGDGFTGINRKFQIKPISWEEVEAAPGERQTKVARQLVVAKWGGELTRVGRAQAEDLGRRLRVAMYPGDEEGGLLRLHSTFRHDLKIYTSDEGRCQVTSAAFTKGFLDLEGELTPILVQMVVRNPKAHSLLDSPPINVESRELCKQLLDNILNQDHDILDESEISRLKDQLSAGSFNALLNIGNPRHKMQHIQQLIERFLEALNSQIVRFDSAILEQRRHAATLASQLDCQSCSDRPVQEWTHPNSRRSRVGSDFSISAACLSSPTLVALQQEDLNTLKDSQDLDKSSSIIARHSRLENRRNFKEPLELLETIQGTQKMSSMDDVEILFNAEVASCASCRLVVLLSERLKEIRHRWIELHDSWFKLKTNTFDSSKIPDIVDNVRFDLIHHHTHIGTQALNIGFEIYKQVEPLGNFVAPAEYGLTPQEKAEIGTKSIPKLLKKILKDVTFFRQTPDPSFVPSQPSPTPAVTSRLSAVNSQPSTPIHIPYSNVASAVLNVQSQKDHSMDRSTCDDHGAQFVPQALPMARSSSTTSLMIPSLSNVAESERTLDHTIEGGNSPRNLYIDESQYNDASPSAPILVRKSSAPNYRPMTTPSILQSTFVSGRPPTLPLEDFSNNRDVPGLSPNGNALAPTVDRADVSHHSSPTHKKRDPATTQNVPGGETYWLVPQAPNPHTSEAQAEGQRGGPVSPREVTSPALSSSVSGLAQSPPESKLSISRGDVTCRDDNIGIDSVLGQSSTMPISKVDTETSSTSGHSHLVINSDSLWAHQPHVKDISSTKESGVSRSAPCERKGRATTQSNDVAASTASLIGADQSVQPLQSLSPSLTPSEIAENPSTQAPLKSLSMDVPSTKKPLVVSSTDQGFEPEGGIYVGYSSHTANPPNRRKGDEKVDKSIRSPAPPSSTSSVGGLKGIHRKASTVSAASVGKQALAEQLHHEGSLTSLGSFEHFDEQSCSVADAPETEDIGDGWNSEDDRGKDVNKDDEENRVVYEEDEDGDDDDDDMLSHFRLKVDEAKQMGIKSPWRIVRSRYYIASASHIISLYNILVHGSAVLNEMFQHINLTTSLNPVSPKVTSSSHPITPTLSSSSVPPALFVPPVPSLPPPSKFFPFASSTTSLGSTLSTTSHPVDYQLDKTPILVDPDVQRDADMITDVHYLSHIVFRVWEKKDVDYSDPQRFRVEIQFSSGAKDGFGSNYSLLREHTKNQQLVFQQHVEHLLSHHAASKMNDESKSSIRSSTDNSVQTESSIESTTRGDEEQQFPSGAEVWGLSPKTAEFPLPLEHQHETPSEHRDQSTGISIRTQIATSSDHFSSPSVCRQVLSDLNTGSVQMNHCRRSKGQKDSHVVVDRARSLVDDPVPPYCEIQPLLRLTKSCPISSLETVFQSVLKQFGPSQTSSSSAASIVAAPSAPQFRPCLGASFDE